MSEYQGSEMEPPEGWMAAMSPEGRAVAETVVTRQRTSLADLISAWAASVRGIMEDRGEYYYDDYAIYLGWREDIDELVATLPEVDAVVVLKAVEPADVRFREHTLDDGGEAMSRKSFTIPKDLWYWRRVPIHGPIARSLGTEKT